jgi:4-amino-4-deoxy-L-arabinose transferase-like glycosyltransferase
VPKPRVWLVAALAIPYLFFLASSGLLGPDEPRYAAIGHQMANSGDWVTPTLWGKPWFEKPPLLYWLIASFDTLGLPPDLAARIPVTLLGLGLLFLLPTFEAAFVLGTSIGWLALSQVAVTDIPLSVCFHTFLFFTLRRQPWPAGIALGLAVLAKGLVPIALGLPVFWLYRHQWRHWVAMLAVAAPWYLACYAANGQAFIDEFIIRHHIQRFLSPELQHVQPFWFYLPVLLGLLMPWAPAIFRLRFTDEQKPYLYTALWGFLFLSISKNKLPAYLLPLLPSIAILIAPRLLRWHYAFAAALLIALPAASPWVPTAIDEGLSKASFSDTTWLWLAASPIAAYAAWRWQQRAVLATLLLAILSLKFSLYPNLASTVSAKNSKLTCLPEGASRGLRYGLSYYLNREVDYCLEPQENVPLLQRPNEAPRDQEVNPGNKANPN